jgi:hypothetical protein
VVEKPIKLVKTVKANNTPSAINELLTAKRMEI